MNLALSIDARILEDARRRAEAMGTSVSQLVPGYLEQFVGKSGSEADAAEFERLALATKGRPRGWTFNRDELHERR